MKQNELRPPEGSKHNRKRVGRGIGSGHGTYSCRGLKGQNSRSGGGVHPLFEGGQNPLVKRLPYKRGFNNVFRVEYAVVNLDRLNIFPEGTEVTPEAMVSAGIIKGLKKPVKVLGDGELNQKLVVKANKFSQTARTKIESLGGTAEVIA
ncbi:50S ribosomal protein L15 [Chloroflexota bacterium]